MGDVTALMATPLQSPLPNPPDAALVACHDCDLLYRRQPLQPGEKARCVRCGALLYENKPNSLERSLALTLTALILFALANVYPFLVFKMGGVAQENTLMTGVVDLYNRGDWPLAGVVFLTSVLAPILKILSMLYVLVPLKFNRRPWLLVPMMKLVEAMHPWAMTEVYLLGLLVAIAKLSDMATIIPGIALYSFAALMFVMAAADAALDTELVWERLESPQ